MSSLQVVENPVEPGRPSRDRVRHVVWVNQHAAPVGGCEQYVLRTAELLRAEGVRNTLLYEVDGAIEPSFTAAFDGAFPLVNPASQLAALQADVCYIHRLADSRFIDPLVESPVACLRFYHDHQLFCLREHKYTTVKQQTCGRTTGLGCYACLGFLHRSDSRLGVSLRGLGHLRRLQAANRRWDGHVAGSDYMAGHLRAHGFDASKLHTLPLFVSQQHLDGPAPTARDGKLIVAAGQLVRGKGLDLLLQAMTRLPTDVRLKLAGEGRQREELERLAAELSLSHRVEFLGRLAGQPLLKLLGEAAVLAMPSRAPETFGLSGLEASSQGVPVVAADVGGISQWLRHGHNGLLVPSGDVAALAEGLQVLLADRQLRRRMGAAGRQRCRLEFGPRRHVRRLLDIIKTYARS